MNRRWSFLVVACAVAGAISLDARAQQTPPSVPEPAPKTKMMTYQAIIISKGPTWTDPATAGGQAARRAYREHVAALMADGKIAIAGGFGGDGALRGLIITPTPPEDATALAAALPGVAGGRYAFEILKWMGPEGWFQRSPDPAQTETIYFGFLVNGPDRTQDQATAQALQRAHLDYMGGQAKIGKLVLAGPLLDGGTRRGLIAYRVPTMGEAVERASADPMIKAGRLAPELYEWTIPKGTLK